MDKPTVLYRGIYLNNKDFETFNLSQIPMPQNSKINDNGEKCVSDGQEYGLYMTESEDLAKIYANVGRTSFGLPISDIMVNNQTISLPHVSIIYEIDATNINIRNPKLNVFKNHQSMYGQEWITDKSIPQNAFRIKEIRVSQDVLHDEKIIDVKGKTASEIKSEVRTEIDKRDEHLMCLDFSIYRVPQLRLNNDFSQFLPCGKAIKILFGDPQPIKNLNDLAIFLQLQPLKHKAQFNPNTVNKIFNTNNLNNTQQKLSQLTGIPIKTDKEIEHMSPLRKFLYHKSLENAKDYLMQNPDKIPKIDTQNHSLEEIR